MFCSMIGFRFQALRAFTHQTQLPELRQKAQPSVLHPSFELGQALNQLAVRVVADPNIA